MTAAPRPPSGAVERRPLRGELARWHHADRLPFLEVALHTGDDDRPPRVDLTTGQGRHPMTGITDPVELRAGAWLLLAAARWLEADRRRLELPQPEAEPDPQLTIYDHLEEATP
jgi:hypothetical protein